MVSTRHKQVSKEKTGNFWFKTKPNVNIIEKHMLFQLICPT